MGKEITSNSMECQVKVGNTTDEILLYYIDKYLKQEELSDTYFSKISNVSATTIMNIRKSVRELNRLDMKKAWPLARVICRAKSLIIRVAIYTNMHADDVNRALKLSGHVLNENSPVEMAIEEWLCEETAQRDITKLDMLIEKNCLDAGFSKDEIDKYLYMVPVMRKTKQN